MPISELTRIKTRLVNAKGRLAMLKKTDRSRDAHEKIQLGGLVVKAGLREADKAFLLGVLVHAAGRRDDYAYFRDMKALGKAAFDND